MQIIASAPQPAGYLTILQHDAPPRRRRCICRGHPNEAPPADARRDRGRRRMAARRCRCGGLFHPGRCRAVRVGFGKVAMMAAFMSGIGWLSARP